MGTVRHGNQRGSTLLELILACTLLGMLVLSATSAQVRARDASEANREVGHRGQIAELASEVLRYHLALAGHRGLGDPLDLQGPALTLGDEGSPASDALTVRYVEERWYAEPTVRSLRIDVRRDGSGRWNLYLKEEGASRQPAVQQVSGLQVTGLVLADGEVRPGDATLPLDVVALEVRLDFTWGESRHLTVSLPTVVRLEAEPS